jgi:hypothetical protein
MRNEMLLLGAGASVEAGVPDSKRMAKEIIKKINGDTHLKKEAEVLNFVNEQLVVDYRKKHNYLSIDCVDIQVEYIFHPRQVLTVDCANTPLSPQVRLEPVFFRISLTALCEILSQKPNSTALSASKRNVQRA